MGFLSFDTYFFYFLGHVFVDLPFLLFLVLLALYTLLTSLVSPILQMCPHQLSYSFPTVCNICSCLYSASITLYEIPSHFGDFYFSLWYFISIAFTVLLCVGCLVLLSLRILLPNRLWLHSYIYIIVFHPILFFRSTVLFIA